VSKVFLDCGAHEFQGLRQFIDILGIDEDWRVHSFEANPITSGRAAEHIDKAWKFHHVFHNCAIGTRDGKVTFMGEYCNYQEAGVPDSQGSRISDNWHPGIYSETSKGAGDGITSREFKVDMIDFPKFIRDTFSKDDEIYIKMDVEGSEFDILEELVKDFPPQIKVMYVEWHERFFPNAPYMHHRRKLYTKIITELGVELKDWI
jgi:FkbM family methyltransferase|tara:strand:+ start:889 stop:1500 length:612 start_codon:yes stop_codon:yes gene_type:complete